MRDYPSTLVINDPAVSRWEAEDIAKWTDLLRTQAASREVVLQAAAVYLLQYDKRSFGLMDAAAKRSDPAALAEAIEQAITRMDRWLQEYEKAKKTNQGG